MAFGSYDGNCDLFCLGRRGTSISIVICFCSKGRMPQTYCLPSRFDSHSISFICDSLLCYLIALGIVCYLEVDTTSEFQKTRCLTGLSEEQYVEPLFLAKLSTIINQVGINEK